MLVPIVIGLLCLVAGAAATARWLPDLALGPVGGLAFVAICGLLGMALAIVGLHIYEIVEVESSGRFGGLDIASELSSMFTDAGPLIGLAIVVFLLSPEPDTDDRSLAASTIETRA